MQQHIAEETSLATREEREKRKKAIQTEIQNPHRSLSDRTLILSLILSFVQNKRDRRKIRILTGSSKEGTLKL